ncbi:pyridoxamine 5'-phosphate oxidase [Oxalobacteraceae bacterium CAVE-383]|nr:pyridoxamine 5'-phosphate oxidase [Oxalobacteraceae bacterium CAVE-383]
MNTFPYHSDEVAAQHLAGVTASGAGIRAFMPDQHRLFFAGLRYVFATATAADGWPVAMVLTGEPGFIDTPDSQTLRIAPQTVTGYGPDETENGLFAEGRQIGLLGIDLMTRRRNRANGRITASARIGGALVITIAIDQSFGNCPQYIQSRRVHPGLGGDGADNNGPAAFEAFSGLDAAARTAIANADTFFIASRSRTDGPGGGADISHRGGRPGFVHIEGEDLWVPDFRGNNFFNTLGNLRGEPRAALLFIDFDSGGVLHLQGEAEIHWRPEAMRHFEGAERFWRFRVQRGWRRAGALPLRWSFIDAAPGTLQSGNWQIAPGAAAA